METKMENCCTNQWITLDTEKQCKIQEKELM